MDARTARGVAYSNEPPHVRHRFNPNPDPKALRFSMLGVYMGNGDAEQTGSGRGHLVNL